MPRHRKPARLYYRADEKQWVIRDGTRQVRTGHGLGERCAAEEALGGTPREPRAARPRGPAHPSELTVGEVLARYVDFKADTLAGAGPATLAGAVAAMTPFWGDLTCDAVKGTTCRAYVRERAIPRQVTVTTRTGKRLLRTH